MEKGQLREIWFSRTHVPLLLLPILGKRSGEAFWGRVLRRGPLSMGFTAKKGFEKGSQKGF